MKFVFVNYKPRPVAGSPMGWISSIKPYLGIPEMLAREHEVDYFIHADFSEYLLHNKVGYHFIPSSRRSLFPGKIHRSIKKIKPDIVFVYGLYFNLQILQLRRVLGKKVKIIVQSHSFDPANGWRKYLERMSYGAADLFFFASKNIAAKWVDNGNFPNDKKIREILPASSLQYPVDHNTALEKTGMRDTKTFLWVGRLNDNKDPLLVVRCFVQFLRLYPDFRLYMIYQTGELEEQIRELVKKNFCEEKIILKGAVSNTDLLYWYNSADFYISGSHNESFGIALCEAISCGVIPVVTDIPSFRKMTGDGEYGVLFEPANENSLMIALEKTLTIDIKKEKPRMLENFETNLSFSAIVRSIKKTIGNLKMW